MSKKKALFLASGGGLHLFDGIALMYALFTPDMKVKWTNVILKIRRDSDNALAFIFVDGSSIYDTITLSSLISTSSEITPDTSPTVTLGDWVGSNSAFVRVWYAIGDNNIIVSGGQFAEGSTTQQPRFMDAGVIETKNGTPYVYWYSASSRLKDGIISATDSGNTFTMIAVAFKDLIGIAFGTIFSTRALSEGVSSRFQLVIDRTSSKQISRIINTSGTTFETNLISQQDNTDQKLLTTIVTATNILGRFNGVQQDSLAWTGSYDSQGLKLGQVNTSSAGLRGGLQLLVIFPLDKTDNISEIETAIDDYFSIPNF